MIHASQASSSPAGGSAPLHLAAAFLGPKAENADVFERLLLEAFRDHVFWRRNFHPEDGFRVSETERRDPSYEQSLSTLAQEMMGLLGELKSGVPSFSPRYVGHMCSDLTMASLLGYFAAMLYNPNNVASEVSPVTTRMELEVAAQLARMIGFDPAAGWGHLTSGGTVANYEAMWVARNLKYLPLAVRWAAEELGVHEVPVRLPAGGAEVLQKLDLWHLLNVPGSAALDAVEALAREVGDLRRTMQAIHLHSLEGMGAQTFGARIAAEFEGLLPPAVVLVPATAHYSWEKICRSLGIGASQLVQVPVDGRFRMDPAAFEETLHALAARRQAVVATVSVVGTTEESAVDRLDLVADVRDRAARELGLGFALHADAAWGGYAASLTRNEDGTRRSYADALREFAPEVWPDEGVFRALSALERTDSVTIDPHKLGFVPYPAGAISLRDRRCRDLITVEAPYVFHEGDPDTEYIGRFIFEGSKPGAAAAAVWMSHKVLPLDRSGYGRLIGETARGALMLHRRLTGGDWGGFRVVPLPRPDLNIVCFAVGHASFTELAQANAFVERIYRAMSAGAGRSARQLDYFVTKTVLRTREYGESAGDTVRALGFEYGDYVAAGGLAVLRCTVMDPFMGSVQGRVDFLDGFIATLRRVFDEQL